MGEKRHEKLQMKKDTNTEGVEGNRRLTGRGNNKQDRRESRKWQQRQHTKRREANLTGTRNHISVCQPRRWKKVSSEHVEAGHATAAPCPLRNILRLLRLSSRQL